MTNENKMIKEEKTAIITHPEVRLVRHLPASLLCTLQTSSKGSREREPFRLTPQWKPRTTPISHSWRPVISCADDAALGLHLIVHELSADLD